MDRVYETTNKHEAQLMRKILMNSGHEYYIANENGIYIILRDKLGDREMKNYKQLEDSHVEIFKTREFKKVSDITTDDYFLYDDHEWKVINIGKTEYHRLITIERPSPLGNVRKTCLPYRPEQYILVMKKSAILSTKQDVPQVKDAYLLNKE